jgi:uncharacterized protein YqeY
MSQLEAKIKADIVVAQKARDEQTLSVLRMLISAIRNQAISLRQGDAVLLSDEQVEQVIRSEVKRRLDSVSAFTQGHRPELAAKEQTEANMLAAYLPVGMSEAEVEALVRQVRTNKPEAAFGQLMGAVMAEAKGRADGNLVGRLVKQIMAE